MSENSYIYAVARIRTKEMQLLNASFLEQLLAAPDEAQCLRLLQERGWGSGSAEEVLTQEHQKTWDLIAELVGDMSVFDVFLYQNDYHNLKAAVKEACTAGKHPGIYMQQGTVPYTRIQKAVEGRNFSLLPERMRVVAEKAMNTLLHTRDGQLCDCIIDKAALEAIEQAGKDSKEELLALYGELVVVTADIKTAVRAQKTGKDRAFLERSLASCDTLDIVALTDAALTGFSAICSYLEKTPYAEAVPELKVSAAAFERWCDNLLIHRIHPQLHNPFGIGPLAAYILARESEIKTVRIILSGKRNDLSEASIRERVRETYV
ncbi:MULTISPECIES: V-type ATPase subunit [Caproicibacterium]|jgi:V/A-type H+-transporting ATPase subunit C|uniref:V-type ATP synthase subunit C n=1 Tax=Caproicibacterium lactatifermentans TaxID=2666138 RepID=A0A859DQZ3_9FIRM|nr:V-type ATPase subunit [Caproicibacterium lactatifermentans]ARP49742.1 V-type ATP synthase subunit C [Ruminococcaceae bacterium CPB6]QKN24527.1 V-type ATP synthase subunit C [Caproicibacterium lactatifermentans]QKO30459.1 V-type ATP synthase subunit C [Caproicibacterium lactatifermentans]